MQILNCCVSDCSHQTWAGSPPPSLWQWGVCFPAIIEILDWSLEIKNNLSVFLTAVLPKEEVLEQRIGLFAQLWFSFDSSGYGLPCSHALISRTQIGYFLQFLDTWSWAVLQIADTKHEQVPHFLHCRGLHVDAQLTLLTFLQDEGGWRHSEDFDFLVFRIEVLHTADISFNVSTLRSKPSCLIMWKLHFEPENNFHTQTSSISSFYFLWG